MVIAMASKFLHNSIKRPRFSTKKTHCESCGEWLEGFDQCSACGGINK
jgi:hypothetical protein